MLEHVSAALNNALYEGRTPTALFIDVDRFKNINDSLGHSAGDDVLIAVAQRLRVALHDNCVVGRISGDEFVVLDSATKTASEAVLLADRVLESFHEPLSLRQGDVFVSAVSVLLFFDQELLVLQMTCCATPTQRCIAPKTLVATVLQFSMSRCLSESTNAWQ